MKRTISEVIDLIKQKEESAKQERNKLYASLMDDNTIPKDNSPDYIVSKYNSMVGNIEAYTDILALLETSHLIEQEKVLDIFKKHLSVELWDMKEYYVANIKDPEYSNYNNCQMYINEEEKKVLEDWLNDN